MLHRRREAAARALGCSSALALALASGLASAQSFTTPTIGSDAAIIFRDYNTTGSPASGAFYPQKSQIRLWGGVIGNSINQAAQLGYALAQGSIALNNGGTGYAQGDTITVGCTDAVFTTPPVLTVNAVIGGVIQGVTVTKGGIATTPPQTCSIYQLSTSGSGSGATFTGSFGLIVSAFSIPALTSGGSGSNGNFFLCNECLANGYGGSESTFVGDKAGGGFWGVATANTALGHDACGVYGPAPSTGGFNTCLGADAIRNISGIASNNTAVGTAAMYNANVAQGNVAIGEHALYTNTTPSYEVAIGLNALFAQTGGGGGDLAIGASALLSLTTAANDIAIGENSGQSITTGGANVLIGVTAGGSLTTGANNIGIGLNALASMVTTSESVGIGYNALTTATAGANTAVGYNSLALDTTGTFNTAIGVGAAQTATTGSALTAVGTTALSAATTASRGTAIGQNSLIATTTGNDNTAVGSGSGSTITTGGTNTIVGSAAGSTFPVAGSNNVLVGYGANPTGDYSNTIGLGVNAAPTASNMMVLGNTAITVAILYGALNTPNLPTSAGSGGLYDCVDTSGNHYRKSSCP